MKGGGGCCRRRQASGRPTLFPSRLEVLDRNLELSLDICKARPTSISPKAFLPPPFRPQITSHGTSSTSSAIASVTTWTLPETRQPAAGRGLLLIVGSCRDRTSAKHEARRRVLHMQVQSTQNQSVAGGTSRCTPRVWAVSSWVSSNGTTNCRGRVVR